MKTQMLLLLLRLVCASCWSIVLTSAYLRCVQSWRFCARAFTVSLFCVVMVIIVWSLISVMMICPFFVMFIDFLLLLPKYYIIFVIFFIDSPAPLRVCHFHLERISRNWYAISKLIQRNLNESHIYLFTKSNRYNNIYPCSFIYAYNRVRACKWDRSLKLFMQLSIWWECSFMQNAEAEWPTAAKRISPRIKILMSRARSKYFVHICVCLLWVWVCASRHKVHIMILLNRLWCIYCPATTWLVNWFHLAKR